MKKIKENLLLVITSLMCFVFILGCLSFSSKAATPQGTLIRGPEFNVALKSFTMNATLNWINEEKTIKRIEFTSQKPSLSTSKSVGENVTAYYDPAKASIYVYCPTKIIFPKQSSNILSYFTAVEAVEFNTDIDTSNVEDFYAMFNGCYKLKKLDVRKFNTSKAVSMMQMFSQCRSLQEIDVTGFNTSNVTDMFHMFGGCTSLKKLDLRNFNTSKVNRMASMFYGCMSLETLNLRSFDTSQVRNFSSMFSGCHSFRTLDLSNFNTSSATKMSRMFFGCIRLESVNLNSFNTSKVTEMYEMFRLCCTLKRLDLSKFDTSNVTKFNMMFHECDSLESLDLSSFVIKKGSNCKKMVYCYTIREIKSPRITEVAVPLNNFSTGDGAFALDDNNDGVPDNASIVKELPVASGSSRYIPYNTTCEIRYIPNAASTYTTIARVNRGANYTLPSFNYVVPEGKEFDRWNEGTPGTSIKMTRNIILRPIWKDKTTEQPNPSDSSEPAVNDPVTAVPADTKKAENIDLNQKTTKLSKLTAGKKSVTVTWKKQSQNIKGYEIQYSTDKNFKKNIKSVTINKAKATSKTIKKLKTHKKYYFRIRTFRKTGSKIVYSKWSKSKNIKIK
ncbi:BspA family leucine-rich repeat surface protein [Butyrivibrio sp. WCD2001]|uniref:BspA family leucine-rich repeat surface protein n=1 Tax=Butyrivibrio sp. WCD2001 TaxID=1280681 RepID=UPI000401D9A5|nr:BspA family leucine-rich repeat surface protein [Butyrivibrio sp. WCD2001]